MEKLVYIIITMTGGIFLMIIHELMKNIVYYFLKKKKVPKDLFYIWKNIDLVGIITTLAMYTPFSKQYRYTISDKKTAMTVGVTGISTLLIINVSCVAVLRCCFKEYILETGHFSTDNLKYYLYLFLLNLVMLSMAMLLANLFPITCFDMGLIVLGSNSKNRSSIIIFDGFLKLMFFLMVALRVFLNASTIITNYSISLFL